MLERFLRLLAGRCLSPLKRYAAAVLIVLAATAVRFAVPIPGLPYLFFMPALMGIGFALGRGPGFLATVLSMLLATFLFVDPSRSLDLSAGDWLASGVFGVVNLGIVAVCSALGSSLLQREADLAALRESRAALASSEAFLRSVLGSSSDCIKVLDLDARLTFMSEGGLRVMEVSDFNAVRGCPWPDFWQGEGNAEAKAAVAAARAGGRGHFRGDAETLAGNPRYWDVQVTPILGSDGRPEKLLSVSRDITGIRAAEEALRVSEAHWRGLFERLNEGMIVGELVRDAGNRATDWRYLDVNSAWGQLVGIDHVSTIGRTIREVFPGIEDEWVMEFVEVVETRHPKTFTRQVGSLGRWYEGRAFALDGDRFAVLFLEVTERVHAEVRRNALLDIGDSLRDFASPEEMTLQVFAIIGQALGAVRVGLGRLDRDSDTVTIGPDWQAPGIASLAGQHRLADYGEIREELLRGQPLVIHDVRSDPRASQNLERWQAIQVRSMVNMPVQEQGRTVALLFVHHNTPHHWDRETLAFLRNVADRLFTSLARLQAEADQRLVNQELSHRMKNMLAMVQAIASQTLKGVTERDAVQSFRSRLMALSHAHDVLLQTTWSAADLRSVVRTVLEGTGQTSRIRMNGPAVTLGPRATLSLSLLLHELTTNAMKHGALSVGSGYVTVDWCIEAASNELVFDWQEHGGPPAREPTRQGFGSQLIRSGLTGTGETELCYSEAGFRAGMRADLDQIRDA
ncbi:PAS domain-containing protein [Roseomonas sp. ACRSG]|nr:PAS domain-containing protein [Roseomonas sp. ACRSG]